jgi:hypothetical protein
VFKLPEDLKNQERREAKNRRTLIGCADGERTRERRAALITVSVSDMGVSAVGVYSLWMPTDTPKNTPFKRWLLPDSPGRCRTTAHELNSSS